MGYDSSYGIRMRDLRMFRVLTCLMVTFHCACPFTVTPINDYTIDTSVLDDVPGPSVLIKDLDIPESFYVQKIREFPFKQMDLHFEVTFKREKASPAIYIYAQTPNPPYNSTYVNLRCFSGGAGFVHVATFSDYVIYLKEGFPHGGCVLVGDNFVCKGMRKLAFAMPRTWYFAVGYPCESPQPLQMKIEFQFDLNAPVKCEVLAIEKCSRLSNQTMVAFPNRVGQAVQADSAALLRTVELLLAGEPCYQHGLLFACKGLFHECRGTGIYPPCLKMCDEFVEGCEEKLSKWNQRVRCGNYPPSLDPGVCLYLPVVCSDVTTPKNGAVLKGGRGLGNVTWYKCDSGFELEGRSMRTCLHSGEWNGTEPVCVKAQAVTKHIVPVSHKWLIGLGCFSILLIGIIIGMCMRYRSSVSLLILHNYYIHGKLNSNLSDEKMKVFLTYSSQDGEHIEKTFLPEMKRHLPMWNVITFERDFLPGRPLVDSINDSVWQSQAVLVMLTENYINSAWCEYEFSEAQTRSAKDKNFRLIIILQEEQSKILDMEKMPEELRSFVTSRIYLTINERLFWNKLRRGLTD